MKAGRNQSFLFEFDNFEELKNSIYEQLKAREHLSEENLEADWMSLVEEIDFENVELVERFVALKKEKKTVDKFEVFKTKREEILREGERRLAELHKDPGEGL